MGDPGQAPVEPSAERVHPVSFLELPPGPVIALPWPGGTPVEVVVTREQRLPGRTVVRLQRTDSDHIRPQPMSREAG